VAGGDFSPATRFFYNFFGLEKTVGRISAAVGKVVVIDNSFWLLVFFPERGGLPGAPPKKSAYGGNYENREHHQSAAGRPVHFRHVVQRPARPSAGTD
jgi:hypothetical protein